MTVIRVAAGWRSYTTSFFLCFVAIAIGHSFSGVVVPIRGDRSDIQRPELLLPAGFAYSIINHWQLHRATRFISTAADYCGHLYLLLSASCVPVWLKWAKRWATQKRPWRLLIQLPPLQLLLIARAGVSGRTRRRSSSSKWSPRDLYRR